MVAEGVKTSKVVMELGEQYGVDLPIAAVGVQRGPRGSPGHRGVPGPSGPELPGRDARHAPRLIE